MNNNIQTNTTGRLTPCLQKKIDKTTYLVEVHFSDTSTQNVEDKLKRVILHNLEHGKQGKPRKSDEYVLDKLQQVMHVCISGIGIRHHIRIVWPGRNSRWHILKQKRRNPYKHWAAPFFLYSVMENPLK